MRKYFLLTFVFMALLFGCTAKNEEAMVDKMQVPALGHSANKVGGSFVKNKKNEETMGDEMQAPALEYSANKIGVGFVENKKNELEYENLMLVNRDNPMPKDFLPNLVDIGNGYKFDENGAKYLLEMFDVAKRDGVNLFVVSAYRSVKKQTQNFNNSVERLKREGYAEQEAYNQTIRYIALPGTSEHSIGLAVDINSLQEDFDQTSEFKWLKENCYKYGFILRYPKNKEGVTKVAYEPWHYRYVGKKHAEKIMMDDITLEEYILQNKLAN